MHTIGVFRLLLVLLWPAERNPTVFSDVQSVPDSQVTYAEGVRKRLVYFRDPEGNILELCEYR